jgi:hypothetical protein
MGHQQYQASELDIEDGTKVFFDDVKTHELGVMTLGRVPWFISTKFRIEARESGSRNLSASASYPLSDVCGFMGCLFDRLCITAMFLRDFF